MSHHHVRPFQFLNLFLRYVSGQDLKRFPRFSTCSRCPPNPPDPCSECPPNTCRKDIPNLGDIPECCLLEQKKIKVTICGGAGQLGQHIAFLLKQSPFVNIVTLYDLQNTLGIAMDLSHIDTKCRIQSYTGCSELNDALINSNIVLITAGVGRVPGMALEDLFEYNAPVVRSIAEACTKACPKALVGILTNPINSLVPMVAEVYKRAKCFDPNRLFGITSIDNMRAATIVTECVLRDCADPAEFLVPVIGGHSPKTIVPVLSQTTPCLEIPCHMYHSLIKQIREAATSVLNVKNYNGSSKLSVALSAARFVNNLIRGLRDEPDIIELAYVYNNMVPGICYFATPFELGPCGITKNLGLIRVDEEMEKPYLREAMYYLKCDIKRGESYIEPDPRSCPKVP